MVLAFGLDHIIIWRDRPTDLSATRYLDNTSTARGKPSIVVEAGYAGIVEADDVDLLVDGTFNTMRALKMLSGNPRPIENPVWLDRVVDVLSDGPGIWYPLVKRGTYVQEGMKIGFVTDYFGKLIREARAPISGVILHINAVPLSRKATTLQTSPPLPPTLLKSNLILARNSRSSSSLDTLLVYIHGQLPVRRLQVRIPGTMISHASTIFIVETSRTPPRSCPARELQWPQRRISEVENLPLDFNLASAESTFSDCRP
jgi:hypothetical protein